MRGLIKGRVRHMEERKVKNLWLIISDYKVGEGKCKLVRA